MQAPTQLVRFGAPLPKPKDAAATLGTHAHVLQFTPEAKPDDSKGFPAFVTEKDLDAMQAAGLKTLRTDLLWGAVERYKGKYDFSKYDHLVKELKKRGMQPMFILGLNNPHDPSGNLTIYPDSNRKAFMNYARAAVKHFSGQGIIWELVQQPNLDFFWHPKPNAKDYASLANDLLPELKKLDPSGSFIAPSLAGHGLDYQKALYPHGILDHVDGVSVHPYRQKGKTPETILPNYEATKALIAQHNPKKRDIPVVLGEWGYNRKDVTPEEQANMAMRQALVGLMVGSPMSLWASWKGDIMKVDDDSDDGELQYGLVTKDIKAYPAYHALQTLAKELAGFKFDKRIKVDNPDHFVLSFRHKDGKTEKLVAWTAEKDPKTIGIPNHYLPVKLTGTPVFIEKKRS